MHLILGLQGLFFATKCADNIQGALQWIFILNCESRLIHKFNENTDE